MFRFRDRRVSFTPTFHRHSRFNIRLLNNMNGNLQPGGVHSEAEMPGTKKNWGTLPKYIGINIKQVFSLQNFHIVCLE